MPSFVEQLWDSVFTPGTTPALLLATNISFLLLQLTLATLLVVTRSVHFVVLNAIAAGLWCAINWFVREVEVERAKERARIGTTPENEHPKTD